MKMNKETASFVKAARLTLDKALRDGCTNEGYLSLLRTWSEQKCCGALLEIVSIERTSNGVKRVFKCGHSHTAISLEEASNIGEGISYSKLEMVDGKQKVGATVDGTRMPKEIREIAVVKLLCHHFKPHLEKFSNDIQDSPVDVIAENSSGLIENFQVTKLYDEQFWRDLSKEKTADRVLPEIESLVGDAIKRKVNFDKGSKTNIILAIDAWPGVMRELAEKMASLPVVRSSNFKEIWIAGSIPEMTFKIYP